MRLKKVGTIQKYPGKEKIHNEENHINSKENVEKVEDTREEIYEISQITQIIDYNELPDGVYDFSGLSELQNRRTRPNLKENEKLLRAKYKKEKNNKRQNSKDMKHQEEGKNIVEELFEAKRNNEKAIIKDFIVEKKEEYKEIVQEEIEVKEVENIQSRKENDENLKSEENLKNEIKESQKVKEEIKNEIKEPVEEKQQTIEKIEEYTEPEMPEYQDKHIEEKLLDIILGGLSSNKRFAFLIMFFLGIITQISFLATSRENNLMGLLKITLSATSIFLLVNVFDIKNKLLIFIISLILVLTPYYNNLLITGENAIAYSFSIILTIFSLNLLFVKKNKIICFVLAVTLSAIGYKIYQNCMYIFLVISILKIIKDAFNRREKISKFLLHCAMICVILVVGIIL